MDIKVSIKGQEFQANSRHSRIRCQPFLQLFPLSSLFERDLEKRRKMGCRDCRVAERIVWAHYDLRGGQGSSKRWPRVSPRALVHFGRMVCDMLRIVIFALRYGRPPHIQSGKSGTLLLYARYHQYQLYCMTPIDDFDIKSRLEVHAPLQDYLSTLYQYCQQ